MAKTTPKSENLPEKRDKPEELTPYQRLTPVQRMVLHDVADGMEVPDLARKYYRRIMSKDEGTQQQRIKKARTRIRKWLSAQVFRDALWDWAIIQADVRSPEVLAGLVHKARAGRVDAARLLLEITGRHAPNTDVQPAAIQLVLTNVPRPQLNQPADVTYEEDEVPVDEDAV